MLRGGFYTPPSLSAALVDPKMDPDPVERLTAREKSILAFYAQGYLVRDIARCLHISVKTVTRKLGHPNRARIRPTLWLGPGSRPYSSTGGRPA